jgi:hypothetical protein
MGTSINGIKRATVMANKRRRKHLDPAGATSFEPDKNECFVLRKCAIYLDRLLGASPLADRETIKLLAWVMGPEMIDLGQILLERMSTKEKQKYEQDIEENILDPDEAPDSICRILRQPGKKRTTTFVIAVRDVPAKQHIVSDLKTEGWTTDDPFPQNEDDYVRICFF